MKVAALFASLAITASLAFATPTIVVGTNMLLPNTANQIVNIYISGGDNLQNVDFSAQIGDGGPGLGGTLAPKFTNVDILTGTIFASNNTGRASGTSNGIAVNGSGTPLPQCAYEGTTTSYGYVAANGLLATLTIDTTGFTSGTWDLKLAGTYNGDTSFFGYATSITNGSITLGVPWGADFNEDGRITDADYTIWADHYLYRYGEHVCKHTDGDANMDREVTDADYTIWADEYGYGATGDTVPEPATMGLLALGGLALIRRRRCVTSFGDRLGDI